MKQLGYLSIVLLLLRCETFVGDRVAVLPGGRHCF